MKRLIARLTGNDEGEIDRILSRDDEFLPSSGFAASVMDAVHREAAAPPPIPFPWKRAVPGLAAAGLVLVMALVAAVVAIARAGKATAPQLSMSLSLPLPSGMPSLSHGGIESAAVWTILALLAAFVSVKISMGLASKV